MRQTICRTALFFCFTLSVAVLSNSAHAQTESVLHSFTGGSDGEYPSSGVTLDQQGRVYGTTGDGGSHQDGVVYRLVREGEGWVFSPIYSFGSQEHDGSTPLAGVVFGPDGLLYGTTPTGGAGGHGTVFSLQPPPTACKTVLCPWLETILYSFSGGADGATPDTGNVIFDRAGNIYGTTEYGGSSQHGVVFELTPSDSGWTESVLWNFSGGSDGSYPLSGVIFDNAGNLYGTTSAGAASNLGAVYELSPTQSGWTETTLYPFTSDSGAGAGGLIWNAEGDLFGITGSLAGGTIAVYELTPQSGGWSFALLYTFTGVVLGPAVPLAFDSLGNLYGPQSVLDEIFKLTPSGNQWIYSQFYEFGGNDGVGPSGVTFDASGNLYGATGEGGAYGYGTVWEITGLSDRD